MDKWISLCTATKNRLWQLKQTLPVNLANLIDGVEINIVDFCSNDGTSEWIMSNFIKDINNGRLRLFQIKEEIEWNASKAKNLSHCLATSSYLFNLDCDNFFLFEDYEAILPHIKKFNIHQWDRKWNSGTYGRIGIKKETFFQLGGYDEKMKPMGGQDTDLLLRLQFVDMPPYFINKPPAKSPIKNTSQDKIKECIVDFEKYKFLNPEIVITYIYRSLLLREPDPEGLKSYTNRLKMGENIKDIEREFKASNEFKSYKFKSNKLIESSDELKSKLLFEDMNYSNKMRSIKRLYLEGPSIKNAFNSVYKGLLNGKKVKIKGSLINFDE